MQRINLIIDALEKAKDGWQSFDEDDKALAAARELRELKPVAWITKGGEGELWWYQSVDENGDNNPKDVALYALDEVKHD